MGLTGTSKGTLRKYDGKELVAWHIPVSGLIIASGLCRRWYAFFEAKNAGWDKNNNI